MLRIDSQQLRSRDCSTRRPASADTRSTAPTRHCSRTSDGLDAQRSLIAEMRAHATDHPQIGADLDAVQAADRRMAHERVDAGGRRGAERRQDRRSGADQHERSGPVRHGARHHHQRFWPTSPRSATPPRRNVTDTGKLIVWTLVGSALVVIIAGFVLAWLLQRMVTRPGREPRGRACAASPPATTTHTVDASGPPEVAALGQDVDEMRRRIVADLRMVQTASEAVEARQRAAGTAGGGPAAVQRGPGAVRLRRLARPAGAAAQGGQLLPAAAAPVRRPARRAGRPVHLVRGRRRAPDAAADQRPAGVLPDRPGHYRVHRPST